VDGNWSREFTINPSSPELRDQLVDGDLCPC